MGKLIGQAIFMHVWVSFGRMVTLENEEIAHHTWMETFMNLKDIEYGHTCTWPNMHLRDSSPPTVHAPSKFMLAFNLHMSIAFLQEMWTELIQANVNTNVNTKFGYDNLININKHF